MNQVKWDEGASNAIDKITENGKMALMNKDKTLHSAYFFPHLFVGLWNIDKLKKWKLTGVVG